MKLDPAEVFPAVHALALRGSLKHLPGDGRQLEAAGLICSTPYGFTLTDSGHRLHRTLSEQERATIDVALLDIVSEPLSAAWRRVKTLEPRWNAADAAKRRRLISELVESIATVWRELHEDYLQTLGYAQESESI